MSDQRGDGGHKVRGQLALEESGKEEVGGGYDLPRDAATKSIFCPLLGYLVVLLITAEGQLWEKGGVYTASDLGEGVTQDSGRRWCRGR